MKKYTSKECLDALKLAAKELPDNFTTFEYSMWASKNNKPNLDAVKTRLGASSFVEALKKAGIETFHKNVEGYSQEEILEALERAKKEFNSHLPRWRYDAWAKKNNLPSSMSLTRKLNSSWEELFPIRKKPTKLKRYSTDDCKKALVAAIEHFDHARFTMAQYNSWAVEHNNPAHTIQLY
ncbi:hypothetical protein P8825_15140 [Shouchella clausii]|uniref:hypothetical protein n=1 Tax=Shouchella clausii TaxID=79880 RepID=UPI002DB6F4BC|nr:hypothetical protein [Shouchella clausii]MEB5480899.1 hypothetical protein [Shouchella clausii]